MQVRVDGMLDGGMTESHKKMHTTFFQIFIEKGFESYVWHSQLCNILCWSVRWNPNNISVCEFNRTKCERDQEAWVFLQGILYANLKKETNSFSLNCF